MGTESTTNGVINAPRRGSRVMDKDTKYFNMSFSQQLIKEPLLFNLGLKFGVEFNICSANVSEAQGHLIISLRGTEDQLKDT